MAAASLWTALQLVCERLENVGCSRHETAIEVNNYKESLEFLHRCWLRISVADQEPNQDPDPHVFVPLRESGSICQKMDPDLVFILLSLSKISKKNLDFYSFVTSF